LELNSRDVVELDSIIRVAGAELADTRLTTVKVGNCYHLPTLPVYRPNRAEFHIAVKEAAEKPIV